MPTFPKCFYPRQGSKVVLGRQLEQPRQGGAKRELAGTGMHGCFLGGWIYDRSWGLPIYRYPNCEAQLQQDQGRREFCFPTHPPNKILMWQVRRGEKTQVIIRGDHRFYRGSKLRQVEQAWRAAKAVVATLYKSRGGCLEAEEAVWMPWWHFCFGGLGDLGLRALVADMYIYIWQDCGTGWNFGQAIGMTGWSFGQAVFSFMFGRSFGRWKLR